ncbi:hypothetical protein FBEOM_13706 [Fusarium beomiforme]|uniref:Uncharacterized protein n=1 Tax=Fusarium beomiforme TaxID=44412 RepID=A0A9P5A573_9HYPO|nr:hypothetical protein FBEOM_13706 [Fusarium beomiforme]
MEPTKRRFRETVYSSVWGKVPGLAFPKLTSPWLSQELEDQARLKRAKQVWDTLALMEKYPGIDLIGFTDPGSSIINMTSREHKANNTKPTTPRFDEKELEEDAKFNFSDVSLKEEDSTFAEATSQVPKLQHRLDELCPTELDKPLARHLKDVQSIMRDMDFEGPQSAFYKGSPKAMPSEDPEQASNHGLTILQLCASVGATIFLGGWGVGDHIAMVTTEAKKSLLDDIREMHVIQNLHVDMNEKLSKDRRMLVDIGKQVAEIRTNIELVRIDRKGLDDVEARAINL